MQVFEYALKKKKINVVTDLVWSSFDPIAKISEEIKKLASEYKLGVNFKNDVDHCFGCTSVPFTKSEKKLKCISLAALVATDPRIKGSTCFVLLDASEIQDGRYFCVALIRGSIIYDYSVELDQAESLYSKFIEECEKTGQTFTLLGSDLRDVQADQVFSLRDIVEAKNSGKKLTLEAIVNEKRIYIITAVIVGLACISAGYYFYDDYVSKEKAIEQSRVAALNSPASIYAREAKAYLNRSDVITADPGAKEIREQLAAIPTRIAGWELSKVTCVEDNCAFRWTNKLSTYDLFKAKAPKDFTDISPIGTESSDVGDLRLLESHLKLKLSKAKLPEKNTWPLAKANSEEIANRWQQYLPYSFNGTVSNPEVMAIPKGMLIGSIKGSPDLIYAQPWNITSQKLWITKSLDGLSPNTVIKTFSLDVNAKDSVVKFSATGYSYVKN